MSAWDIAAGGAIVLGALALGVTLAIAVIVHREAVAAERRLADRHQDDAGNVVQPDPYVLGPLAGEDPTYQRAGGRRELDDA